MAFQQSDELRFSYSFSLPGLESYKEKDKKQQQRWVVTFSCRLEDFMSPCILACCMSEDNLAFGYSGLVSIADDDD